MLVVPENLDGHPAVKAAVVREADLAHRSTAKKTENFVASDPTA